MAESDNLHEVVITAIVVRDGRYLIERRAASKKRFPGRWSVPGGRLELADYVSLPRDTEQYWYNVLEKTLRREVKEEIGIEIENIRYVTSLATVHQDGTPSLVISCLADYSGGEVRLDSNEVDDIAWVTLDEVQGYDLIDGIYDELVMADRLRKGEQAFEWSRSG